MLIEKKTKIVQVLKQVLVIILWNERNLIFTLSNATNGLIVLSNAIGPANKILFQCVCANPYTLCNVYRAKIAAAL